MLAFYNMATLMLQSYIYFALSKNYPTLESLLENLVTLAPTLFVRLTKVQKPLCPYQQVYSLWPIEFWIVQNDIRRNSQIFFINSYTSPGNSYSFIFDFMKVFTDFVILTNGLYHCTLSGTSHINYSGIPGSWAHGKSASHQIRYVGLYTNSKQQHQKLSSLVRRVRYVPQQTNLYTGVLGIQNV